MSPTGRRSHGIVANRLRDAFVPFLAGSDHAAYQDINLLHRSKVYIPDLCVAPRDLDSIPDPHGWGADATRVPLVAEVVSPGREARQRDLVRKHRAYAQAGLPVYVVIDERDGPGHVTVHTQPDPAKGVYEASIRMPYGTGVTIPDGPAKGFVIDTTITGEPRES